MAELAPLEGRVHPAPQLDPHPTARLQLHQLPMFSKGVTEAAMDSYKLQRTQQQGLWGTNAVRKGTGQLLLPSYGAPKAHRDSLDMEHPVAPFLVREADLRENGCPEKQWHC